MWVGFCSGGASGFQKMSTWACSGRAVAIDLGLQKMVVDVGQVLMEFQCNLWRRERWLGEKESDRQKGEKFEREKRSEI